MFPQNLAGEKNVLVLYAGLPDGAVLPFHVEIALCGVDEAVSPPPARP